MFNIQIRRCGCEFPIDSKTSTDVDSCGKKIESLIQIGNRNISLCEEHLQLVQNKIVETLTVRGHGPFYYCEKCGDWFDKEVMNRKYPGIMDICISCYEKSLDAFDPADFGGLG